MLKRSYPQAMPMQSKATLEGLLSQETIGVLCTVDPDLGIHAAPIYFLYDDGVFVMGTQPQSRKVRNLRRDPRATFLVEKRSAPFQSVTAYGTAQVIDGDGVYERRLDILTRRSSADDASALADHLAETWGLVEIRLKPDRLVTVDYGA
jgi:PPOX class probable F420-dependent enzyme